jgi:peptidoglycan/xylan/chitin deacetylase (PgdA/CDA1 family)
VLSSDTVAAAGSRVDATWDTLVGTADRRTAPGETLILTYHRVADPKRDLWSLSVSPERFAAQVDALAARYDIVPLVRASEPAERRRRVVITFDDGYADNLGAAHLLASKGVPATFFITVGQLGRAQFWWDELGRILFGGFDLPESVSVVIAGERLTLPLRPAGRQQQDRPEWRAWQPPSTPLEHTFTHLYNRLLPLDHDDRARALADLAAATSVPQEQRDDMRALTAAEFLELSALEGVEIGAHTVTHPQLARLPSDRQRDEIVASRLALEEMVGKRVASFAYPNGRRGVDFDEVTMELVAEAGFRFACASEGGPVRPTDRPLDLPRWMVNDWEADDLVSAVEAAFRAGSPGMWRRTRSLRARLAGSS